MDLAWDWIFEGDWLGIKSICPSQHPWSHSHWAKVPEDLCLHLWVWDWSWSGLKGIVRCVPHLGVLWKVERYPEVEWKVVDGSYGLEADRTSQAWHLWRVRVWGNPRIELRREILSLIADQQNPQRNGKDVFITGKSSRPHQKTPFFENFSLYTANILINKIHSEVRL